MKTPKLTRLDSEMLLRLHSVNARARQCSGVHKQALNRLVKKGRVRRFKGAFGEDEWEVVRPAKPEYHLGYMQGRGAA